VTCSVGWLIVINLSGGNSVRVRRGDVVILLCAVGEDVIIIELLFNDLCIFVYTNRCVWDIAEILPD